MMRCRDKTRILALVLLSACTPSKAEVFKAEPKPGEPVEVITVQTGNLVVAGEYNGRVEPRSSVSLSAEVSGQALSVMVDEGDRVQSGALLLTIQDERFRLARDQAQQNLVAAQIRVEQLEASLTVEEAQLSAALAQAEAAVDSAQAHAQMVEAGARPAERKQAKANKVAAEAARANAARELARTKDLLAGNVASQQQLDKAQAAFDSANAQYEASHQAYRIVVEGARQEDKDSATASLAQAEAVRDSAMAGLDNLAVREKDLDNARVQVKLAEIALANAEYDLGKTRLSSPLDGETVVVARQVEPGEVVAPGTPLLELVDLSKPKVRVSSSGMDVALLKEGTPVPVYCLGEGVPGRTGRISMVGVQADAANTTYPVEVDVDNKDGNLRSGQLCTVVVPLKTYHMILVPSDAVLDTESGKMVVVVEDDRARLRSVKLAAVQGAVAAISDGLKAGDQVVVSGERLVKDGDLVRIMDTRPGPDGMDGGES